MNQAKFTDAALTNIGKKRRNNEDAVLSLREYGVFCVADGMGGGVEGEMASHLVVTSIHEGFHVEGGESAGFNIVEKAKIVSKAVSSANRQIRKRVESRHDNSETGSTVVVLVLDGQEPARAMTLHAGDSRVYIFRNNKLSQVTVDHSVAEAVNAKDEKKLPFMLRGVITRAVGLEADVELERKIVNCLPGDVFLLCSDGINRMLSDGAIAGLLRENEGEAVFDRAKILIDAANEAGGHDNVTVILTELGKNQQWEELDPETSLTDFDYPTSDTCETMDCPVWDPEETISQRPVATRVYHDIKKMPKIKLVPSAILALMLMLIVAIVLVRLRRDDDVPLMDDQLEVFTPARGPDVGVATLMQYVSEAEKSGDWGKVAVQLKDAGINATLKANLRLEMKYDRWMKVWEEALADVDELESKFKAHHELLDEKWTAAGFKVLVQDLIAWPEDGKDRASFYCRLLHDEQRSVQSELDKFLSVHLTRTRAFAVKPQEQIKGLFEVSGAGTEAEALQLSMSIVSHRQLIQVVKKWGQHSVDGGLDDESIQSFPSGVITQSNRLNDEIWNAIRVAVKQAKTLAEANADSSEPEVRNRAEALLKLLVPLQGSETDELDKWLQHMDLRMIATLLESI